MSGSVPGPAAVPHRPADGLARRRLFLHDVALTMAAEAGTVVASLVITAIVSRWMGARSLSEYLLLRRVLGWSVAAVLLGLATGLPHYVARCAGQAERSEPAYFLAALVCLVPAGAVVGCVLFTHSALLARWLFGSSSEAGLVVALAIMLFGFCIHRAVCGYYRGLLAMARANLLELCNAAIVPLAVVAALAHTMSVAWMMGIVGAVMVVSATLFALPVLGRLRGGPPLRLRARCGQLLRYGLSRVPGEFGAAALIAIGPMFAVHFVRIASISSLLLGINILVVIGYASGPLGIVLLSKLSMMLGMNQHDAVQARLRLLLVAVIELSAFACIQLTIFADVLVRAWVGPGFLAHIGVIRTVLLAIPPYLFFTTLRSTIDAATVKPWNTVNVLITLAIYVALLVGWLKFFPGRSLLAGIAGSLLASEVLLAVLTVRTFRRLYGLSVPWRQVAPSLAAAAVLGLLAFALHASHRGPLPVIETLAVELVFAAAYLAFLIRTGSGWISYTWNVGILRRADWQIAPAQPGTRP